MTDRGCTPRTAKYAPVCSCFRVQGSGQLRENSELNARTPELSINQRTFMSANISGTDIIRRTEISGNEMSSTNTNVRKCEVLNAWY